MIKAMYVYQRELLLLAAAKLKRAGLSMIFLGVSISMSFAKRFTAKIMLKRKKDRERSFSKPFFAAIERSLYAATAETTQITIPRR